MIKIMKFVFPVCYTCKGLITIEQLEQIYRVLMKLTSFDVIVYDGVFELNYLFLILLS